MGAAAGRRTCREQGAATGRMLRGPASTSTSPRCSTSAARARRSRPRAAPSAAIREQVARCGDAFAAALERRGVAPTAKHFPGLGAAAVNTDAAVQRIELSKRRLRRVDERPYRRFVRRRRRAGW